MERDHIGSIAGVASFNDIEEIGVVLQNFVHDSFKDFVNRARPFELLITLLSDVAQFLQPRLAKFLADILDQS